MELVIQKSDFELVNADGYFDLSDLDEWNFKAIEIFLKKDSNQNIMVSANPFQTSDTDSLIEHPIYLEDLLNYIEENKADLTIFCHFLQDSLELQVIDLIQSYSMNDQIKFTGKINPIFISTWDHHKIYYDIENCLPQIYEQDQLKEHHINVFSYFCNRYKVRNICIRNCYFYEEILDWLEIKDLQIGLYQTFEEQVEPSNLVDYLFVNFRLATTLASRGIYS